MPDPSKSKKPAKKPKTRPLVYVCRTAFRFAGHDYEQGDVFDHPTANSQQIARMQRARRIELCPTKADGTPRKPARRKQRKDKVVINHPSHANHA